MATRTKSTSDERAQPGPPRPGWDQVDEAGWESFPASDPPAHSRRTPKPAPPVAKPAKPAGQRSADQSDR